MVPRAEPGLSIEWGYSQYGAHQGELSDSVQTKYSNAAIDTTERYAKQALADDAERSSRLKQRYNMTWFLRTERNDAGLRRKTIPGMT